MKLERPRRSGDYTPESVYVQDSILLAGDAIGTPDAIQGLKLGVNRTLPFRRLYVAACIIPSMTTGYIVGTTSCTFNLIAKNDKSEFLRWSWDNSNAGGFDFPGATQRKETGAILRPAFRISNRLQQQPFAMGWPEPMSPDSAEAIFRTTATGPMPDAVEWLVQCAPFRFLGEINELSLNVENSTSVSPDQILMFLGCLSSSEYQ